MDFSSLKKKGYK